MNTSFTGVTAAVRSRGGRRQNQSLPGLPKIAEAPHSLLYHPLSILKMSDIAEKKFPHRMDLWILGRLTPTGAVNFSAFSQILLLQLPAFPCKIQLSSEKEALYE
nr:hypothetical protein [uncultured Oscillibacter sp.]